MPSSRAARWLLAVSLVLGAGLRWNILSTDHGIFWPDEIYQSLEPAHALVYGHGLIPWEFIDGARNWALPGVVAFILEVAKLVGADQPSQYLIWVRVVFALASLAAAFGTFKLASSIGADELSASAAGSVVALAAPMLYFSHRAMSENATLTPLVFGLALLFDKSRLDAAFSGDTRARRFVWLGASLLGLAVLFRLQSAVVCVVVLAVLAAWKRFRALRDVTLVLIVWAFLFGALDAFTWHDAPNAKFGGWFHSAVVYLRFNLIEGKAAGWGVAAWHFFAQHLFDSMPVLMTLLTVGAIAGAFRSPALFATALVFFALHSASPHKEYRFILPVIPMLAALAASAISAVSFERLRFFAAGALVLAVGFSAVTHRSLTFGQLGQYPGREADSAWDDNGPVNRLMLVASTKDDLCGLFTPVHPAWMGGASYLHRKAPHFTNGWPLDCFRAGACNYAIVPKNNQLPPIAEDGPFILVKVPDSPCTPVPNYPWRLP